MTEENQELVVYSCEKVVLDVDNTILDTNGHFHNAQEKMLAPLAERGVIENPEQKVDELRDIDMEIADKEGKNEYNFELLSRALSWYYLEDVPVEEAVENREEENGHEDYVEEATNRFYNHLNSPHKLVPGFDEVYGLLNKMDSEVIAFSEGEEERIKRELKENEVYDVFDYVVTGEKTPNSFEWVVGESNSVVVGDSLERDIMPANEVGCLTVHKPAGFCEDNVDAKPDIEIENISQFVDIFHSNGNILLMK